MRLSVIVLALGCLVLSAQTASVSVGSIQGTVTDADNKPIAGALVTITRTFASPKQFTTPYSQSVKTASDGSFLAQGLPPGSYSYCAQPPGDGYLDGCHWGTRLLSVTLAAGQRLKTAIRIDKGSILNVRVLDPANLALQQSHDKKTPPILMGVWDSRGRFVSMQSTGKDSTGFNYQLTIPRDTPLSFQFLAAKLKVSDSAGMSLLGSPTATSASQTAFQHTTGDPSPKSFQFTITGVTP